MLKAIFVFLLTCLALLPEKAQADTGVPAMIPDSVRKDSFRIYYPVSKIDIRENYMDNSENLERIRRFCADTLHIDSLVIFSYASPEGTYAFNKRLSAGRGETARKYILEHIFDNARQNDIPIYISPTAENWEGLLREVKSRYHRRDRNRVIGILESPVGDGQKKARLKALDGGRTWQYLRTHIMPHLRYATWTYVWHFRKDTVKQALPQPAVPADTIKPLPIDTLPLPTPQEETADTTTVIERTSDTKTILSLKTNLLYDAVTWINFAVEVPVYKDRLSLVYMHQCPWFRWGKGRNEYCNRFLSIGGEARWWFRPMPREPYGRHLRRDKLMGHYIGVYGMGGKWDFEWKRKICYQGEFWSTGLSYGFSKPIGRRLNLEFGISLGYASIPYRNYTPTADYGILLRNPDKTGTWHYFGPTQLEISLVLPIVKRYWTTKGGNL